MLAKVARKDHLSEEDIPQWAALLVTSLLAAMNERDPYTHGHLNRVGTLAGLLAKAAGLSERDQLISQYSGLFHDLGKIGIPDSILLKEGRLDENEEKVMQLHPIKSLKIIEPLNDVKLFSETFPAVKHHHESIDGTGYPSRLVGDAIPLIARIVTIVDAFDAMTTSRVYRRGRHPEMAVRELKVFAGRQFDRELVEIFVKARPEWKKLEEEMAALGAVSQIVRAA